MSEQQRSTSPAAPAWSATLPHWAQQPEVRSFARPRHGLALGRLRRRRRRAAARLRDGAAAQPPATR